MFAPPNVFLRGLSTVFVLLLFVPQLWAQSGEPQNACSKSGGSAPAVVRACSDLILKERVSEADLAALLVVRGRAYYDEQTYSHALTDFDEAIALDPKNVEAFRGRADSYYMTHDYDHAIADYTETIRLNPESREAFLGRANSYFAKKDLQHAMPDMDHAIRPAPSR